MNAIQELHALGELFVIEEGRTRLRREYYRQDKFFRVQLTAWNERHSPFLRLPAEIRSKIYEFALGGLEIMANVQRHSRIIHWHGQTKHGEALPSMFHYLPLVCYQIYRETSNLAFKHNSFAVHYDKVEFFLTCIGQAALSIQILTIRLRDPINTLLRHGYHPDSVCAKLRDLATLGALRKVNLVNERPGTSAAQGFSDDGADRVFSTLQHALQGHANGRRVAIESLQELNIAQC